MFLPQSENGARAGKELLAKGANKSATEAIWVGNMMFRAGVMCACLVGLSACVATPSGPAEFVSRAQSLSEAQLELRQNAAALDTRFHEAGWVAEEHGAVVQRLTGMLMFGRGDNDRQGPVEVYFEASGLTGADSELIRAAARRDLAEATSLVHDLAVDGEQVAEAQGLTASSLNDDLGALEYAISDVRQALSLFREINDEYDAGEDDLSPQIGSLELASERLSGAADALMSRRRELRNSIGS